MKVVIRHVIAKSLVRTRPGASFLCFWTFVLMLLLWMDGCAVFEKGREEWWMDVRGVRGVILLGMCVWVGVVEKLGVCRYVLVGMYSMNLLFLDFLIFYFLFTYYFLSTYLPLIICSVIDSLIEYLLVSVKW